MSLYQAVSVAYDVIGIQSNELISLDAIEDFGDGDRNYIKMYYETEDSFCIQFCTTDDSLGNYAVFDLETEKCIEGDETLVTQAILDSEFRTDRIEYFDSEEE